MPGYDLIMWVKLPTRSYSPSAGHHATPERAMGSVLQQRRRGSGYAQNNYAEIEKVAIVDWDVHHERHSRDFYATFGLLFSTISIPGIRAQVTW